MREPVVFTEALRAGAAVRIGRVLLLPIERTVLRAGRGRTFAWSTATKELHALVVRDSRGAVWAVGADARPVSLEALRARVPGLDGLLAGAPGPPG